MKVLLVVTDLYKAVGGGQTVYRKIIESTPDVQFFYFRLDESSGAQRPPNSFALPLRSRRRLEILSQPSFPAYKRLALAEADRYARSVEGQNFDLVDIPDFYTFGSFLRQAFKQHNVSVNKIILAMHGNISDSINLNWGSDGDNALQEQVLEEAQFLSVDGRYAVSKRYIKEWQSTVKGNVTYIDPLSFVSASFGRFFDATSRAPSLYCIGRSERRKGNDLFVELVAWLRRSSFEKASHIGKEAYSETGISSKCLLENISKKREVNVDYSKSMSHKELFDLYSRRSIVILPVRYDTLNLTALEALFSGCPVVISDKAGVCDYLDENYPGLPYIKINFDNFYSAVEKIQGLIDNYTAYRHNLESYIVAQGLHKLNVQLNMREIYAQFLTSASAVGSPEQDVVYREKRRVGAVVIASARAALPKRAYERVRAILLEPRKVIRERLERGIFFADARAASKFLNTILLTTNLRQIGRYPEKSYNMLRVKKNNIYRKATGTYFRCNYWAEIARIERILGNDLIAATYELRILRLLGSDKLHLLPQVIETLNANGFEYEATAAQAIYGDNKLAEQNVYKYLEEAFDRNRVKKEKPWLYIKDYRAATTPRVSVIVSLYRAADKLNFFLSALFQQTLLKNGEVEVILVDSGSPSNEEAVFNDFYNEHGISAVYARSENRETIQSAWNRGIGLARAPYLVFLGVDETLYPEGLEVLARTLDECPEVDWVMANSHLTAVEENGIFNHDIMTYVRDGGTKEYTYLETCYLSWVGGMYRNNIHERFGYYDESFGAAGDTEFKSRILPYIRVKFLPRVLGLFLNYPDGQTTASPKAEIEDLRAWYIHRTVAGAKYAFRDKAAEDAEALLLICLGYRKSYCGHVSTDFEYAKALAEYLMIRGSRLGQEIHEDLCVLQNSMRQIELLDKPSNPIKILTNIYGQKRKFKAIEAKHRSKYRQSYSLDYNITNDNRYEQHSWLWKS